MGREDERDERVAKTSMNTKNVMKELKDPILSNFGLFFLSLAGLNKVIPTLRFCQLSTSMGQTNAYAVHNHFNVHGPMQFNLT